MIRTFKFRPQFYPQNEHGGVTLGPICAGRIVRSEPVVEDDGIFWVIEVDDDPPKFPPRDIYCKA